MKPAGALTGKNCFPIHITRLQLRDRSVPAVRTPNWGTKPETALREIQPIAHRASNSIKGNPADVRLVDATLINEVLNQASNRIVRERGDQGRIHAEASTQSACDVILASALPNPKCSRGRDAAVARIQPQHHFAETHEVPATGALRLDL